MRRFIIQISLPVFFLALVCLPQSTGTSVSSARKQVVIPPEKASPVTVPKFDSEPTIDGNLDEPVWQTAAQFKDFVQTEPGDLIAPSKETVAYMGYNAENLYIGFFCFDEPDLIRATVAKRDAVGAEDNVGIFLDTFNDQRRAYILQFNPFGIQADGIRATGEMGSDLTIDIVMESKGMILPNGWSVEVKIPFESLRYKAGKGEFWGIDFTRRIDRLNRETDRWMPIERGISDLQQLGKITGLDEIKTQRNLEIVPTLTLSEDGERVADENMPPGFSRFINRPIKPEIGVSIKFQITPNITFDAAINPDFAEVEADAPVVRANQRFPIFFPEKRPFFLEGKDYFNSNLQVVNTRNIANPDVALKLTGKTGRNTFAVLGAIDDFPDENKKAYVGVLRLKRDIGENSNIGLFATQYHFGSQRHNSLGGFDGKFQLDSRSEINFQVVGTYTRGFFFNPDTNSDEYRTGIGIAYTLSRDYTGRNRGWVLNASGRSRDYRADVGFTRQTNTHGMFYGYRLQTEPKPDRQLIKTTLRGSLNGSIDEEGRVQNAISNSRLSFEFQDLLRIGFSGGFGLERIYENEFGARRNESQAGAFFGEPFRSAFQYFGEAGIEKTFNERVSFSGEIGFVANQLDLDFGASEKFPRVSPAYLQYLIARQTDPSLEEPALDPGKGFNLRYEADLDLQPTDAFSVRLGYDRTKLTRKDTKLTAFDANIFSVRSTYQFTRFIFARARWDYETIDGTLNGQMLFGWNPNPGTSFYVGYNENLLYKGFNEYTNGFDPGLRRDGRSFFIRLSYLFRKSF